MLHALPLQAVHSCCSPQAMPRASCQRSKRTTRQSPSPSLLTKSFLCRGRPCELQGPVPMQLPEHHLQLSRVKAGGKEASLWQPCDARSSPEAAALHGPLQREHPWFPEAFCTSLAFNTVNDVFSLSSHTQKNYFVPNLKFQQIKTTSSAYMARNILICHKVKNYHLKLTQFRECNK